MKHKFFIFGMLFFLFILPLVSSQELWSFSNFQNKYKVYNSHTCNVFGTITCPNEMGWEGNSLSFKFTLNNFSSLSGLLRFNIETSYFINQKPIDVYVNGHKIASNLIIDGMGVYSINFTRGFVSPGANTIKIVMKKAPVGYGKPSAGFVLGRVSLDSIEGVILANCFKNSDCGTNGFINIGFCSGLKINQDYITYKCINPGLRGYCSSSVSVKLVETCTAKCDAYSPSYCKGNDIYHFRTCYSAGCSNGACNSAGTIEEKKVKTCSSVCLNGACVLSLYSVQNKNVGTNLERQFYYENTHFMTIIETGGAIAIRPHPGTDVNGWGSTLYLQPFLPGAVLKNSKVNSAVVSKDKIIVVLSGKVSKGNTESYGTWTSTLVFKFDNSTRKISGNGVYNISLSGVLSSSTGDLNLYKLASNYLNDVPILDGGIGDTGDMENAVVVGDNFSFNWIPEDQPGHFPTELTTRFLSIDVKGDYNNVDTARQGYAAIAAAVKPSIKVSLNSGKAGIPMVFGGIYDLSQSKNFWSDNVGITPLILKTSTDKKFNFAVNFESTAISDGYDGDNDGQTYYLDCDDSNANVWENLQGYVDADEDGYGTENLLFICSGNNLPQGYSINNNDCNDDNSNVNPSGEEISFNLIDDNCNGQIDENNCIVPTDGMNITTNTKLCYGTYNLPNGVFVKNFNSTTTPVVLDCNGSKLIGIGQNTGIAKGPIYSWYINNYYQLGPITVKNCEIINYTYGIYIFHGYSDGFYNNTISESSEGAFFDYGHKENLSGNIFNGNARPLELYWGSSEFSITKNTFTNSRYGIYIDGADNQFLANNFINNQEDFSPGVPNTTVFGAPNNGNYWSNYDSSDEGCNDLNSDGVCDLPYVFNNLTDSYASVSLY